MWYLKDQNAKNYNEQDIKILNKHRISITEFSHWLSMALLLILILIFNLFYFYFKLKILF